MYNLQQLKLLKTASRQMTTNKRVISYINNSNNNQIVIDVVQRQRVFMQEGFKNIKEIIISTDRYHEQAGLFGNIDLFAPSIHDFEFKNLKQLVLTGTYSIINDFFNCFCFIAQSAQVVEDDGAQIAGDADGRLYFSLLPLFKQIVIQNAPLKNFLKILSHDIMYRKRKGHAETQQPISSVKYHKELEIWLENSTFTPDELQKLYKRFHDKICFNVSEAGAYEALIQTLKDNNYSFGQLTILTELKALEDQQILDASFQHITDIE